MVVIDSQLAKAMRDARSVMHKGKGITVIPLSRSPFTTSLCCSYSLYIVVVLPFLEETLAIFNELFFYQRVHQEVRFYNGTRRFQEIKNQDGLDE